MNSRVLYILEIINLPSIKPPGVLSAAMGLILILVKISVAPETVEGSRNLIRMQVHLGKEYGEKKILAGISTWYTPKDLIGKKFIFVANLEPKQMMKESSNGMILCADDGEKALLIPVDDSIPEGSVVK